MASRWHIRVALVATFLFLLLLIYRRGRPPPFPPPRHHRLEPVSQGDGGTTSGGRKLDWSRVPHRYPVANPRPLPSTAHATPVPRIQARFGRETGAQKR